MPFIGDILKFDSLSIVGVEKNTGKTECLNYIIKRLQAKGVTVALTSVGIDGESIDQVTMSSKPEIEIFSPMLYVTSEKHFHQRRFMAEILDVSRRATSLGRLVTARALEKGKVLLSGPSDTTSLVAIIAELKSRGAAITLVDGALSRKSLGAPSVTDAMILATGAAWSANLPLLVRKTKYVCDLIALPEVDHLLRTSLANRNHLCSINQSSEVTDLGLSSVFELEKSAANLFCFGHTLYVPGAVTDKLLNHLRAQKEIKHFKLIVKDFTRIFASPEAYRSYTHSGGSIAVLNSTHLVAVSINPVAPNGTTLNSDRLRGALSEMINVPVWDVRKLAS